MRGPVVCVLLWVGALAPPAGAQEPAAVDSQRVLKDAQAAQRRFERTRRQHMRWGVPTYGRCDQRIGRYCLSDIDWGDEEEWWTEPEEDPRVGAAREKLVAHLDSAARLLPGDGWIAAQRVRYLVEADDSEAAVRAARACRSRPLWWCSALAGFAHYAGQDFVAADRAYAEALAGMEHEERCEWTDLSDVLTGAVRGRYRRLPCADRDSLQRRILWLADPLFGVPGNELAAEHYSRQVHSAMLQHAEAPEGDRWGSDLHEFIMRYGWTMGWERLRVNDPWTSRPLVRGHFGHGAKYFLPEAALVENPVGARRGDWDLEPDRPKAGHAPPYAASGFDTLTHELAAFRRGDALVFVTAFELEHDSLSDTTSVTTALVMARDELSPPTVTRRTIRGRRGRLTAIAPTEPVLLSLEAWSPAAVWAARARYGVAPTTMFARPALDLEDNDDSPDSPRPDDHVAELSSLVLTYAEDSLPETLRTAAEHARPHARLQPGERFGLYWEYYGTGPESERLSTSLTVTKRGKSFLERVGAVFGFGSDKPPVGLRWEDVTAPGGGYFSRAVAVDLPSNIDRGSYLLTLQVGLERGEVIRVDKRIEVRN